MEGGHFDQTASRRRSSVPMRIFKAVLVIVGIVVLAAAVLVGVLTAAEYRPADAEAVQIGDREAAQKAVSTGDALTFVSWNIGYCGLSDEADFFMDGGSGVRTVSLEGVRENLDFVDSAIAEMQPDVVLLQEVDRNSSRSYGVDEVSALAQSYSDAGYSNAFAPNYKVLFVPYPVPPLGAVDSGILTLSRLAASSDAERVQLPCPFAWPIRVANLKRCLLVERAPVEGTDKELVIVNLHLEAFDDGEGKIAQTERLVSLMRDEYEKGNYVVVGGDFNQSFSNVDTAAYPMQGEGLWECGYLDVATLGEGFTALMDPTTPTCRSLDRPYDADDESFQYYMIDGFIVSDNVEVQSIKTVDMAFEHSDHNPVKMEVRLLP